MTREEMNLVFEIEGKGRRPFFFSILSRNGEEERVSPPSIRHTAPASAGHNAVLGNKLQRYGSPP